MSYNNFRFYLTDDPQFSDLEDTSERIKQILHNADDLELERVAVDLSSQQKSISLLCQSKEYSPLHCKVTALLSDAGFTVKETEVEALEDEDEHHDEHDHHHEHKPKKKRKRKSVHQHTHDHDHECEHGHDHDHNHTHDHGRTHDHGHKHEHGHAHGHHHGHVHDNHWLKATLGLIWGAGLLILSLTGFAIPAIAYYVITGLTTLMTLYLGRTVYQSAWNALREKRWDMTTLYAISTLTIVVVSLLSLFLPGLPMMFEAAPFVLGFWHLGEGIEHSLIDKINTKLDVRDHLPEKVLLKGNPDKEILTKRLIPNDIIIIKNSVEPKGVIPVDGILTTSVLLYTTSSNGSPIPKLFHPGDLVEAGMTFADPKETFLEMRVTKLYKHSYLSRVAQKINQANKEKAPIELFTNKVLKYFIPTLLGVAIVSGIVIGAVFTPALAIQSVISVLVSACPCALSLITPMAVRIGMKKASENGIHFNNGKALQAAADIDTVVFDLNGTLTKGEITINDFQIDDTTLLSYVALLEAQTSHGVAQAIRTYIEKKGIVPSEELEITEIDKENNSGIKAKINGEIFMIGTEDMLLANNITHINAPYDNPEKGSLYIVRGTTVVGQIDATDPLRDDAKETIKKLQDKGISVHICTGSNRRTAERYAKLLNIPLDNICANAVGDDSKKGRVSKLSYIKKLKGKIAFVGDSINDIAAIAGARLGIAIKSAIGSEITEQKAGMVLRQGLLFPIVTAFDVAKKTKANITQNLIVSLTYNSVITLVAAGLFIALGFALNPAIGVALMVLESTIVLANLYRFKRQKVTVAETNKSDEKRDELGAETTTSKMLKTFGPRPQSQTDLTNTQEPDTQNSQSGAFFTAVQSAPVVFQGAQLSP